MKAGLIAILAVFTVFFGAVTASACECRYRRTIGEEVRASEHIVMLLLKSVEIDRARLVVVTVYKGGLKPDEEIVFEQGRGRDCKWHFDSRDRQDLYLFYLPKRPENGVWQASTCSRSGPADKVEEDLGFIREIRVQQLKKFIKPPSPPPGTDNWRPPVDQRIGSGIFDF